MILKIHSDASYLSEPRARSRAAGHFYMGNKGSNEDTNNGSILATTQVMKAVLASASEAEIGALFENCKRGTILRTTLNEMGHPQPTTPVQTDNSTACGIANANIKQQRSRAIDMRFYWVRDHSDQGEFGIIWGPGSGNRADYYSKHHPPAHHQAMRPLYLHTLESNGNAIKQCNAMLTSLRGCVKPAPMLSPTNQTCSKDEPAGTARHASHSHAGDWLTVANANRTKQTDLIEILRAFAHS
jgi:hypothetical protein